MLVGKDEFIDSHAVINEKALTHEEEAISLLTDLMHGNPQYTFNLNSGLLYEQNAGYHSKLKINIVENLQRIFMHATIKSAFCYDFNLAFSQFEFRKLYQNNTNLFYYLNKLVAVNDQCFGRHLFDRKLYRIEEHALEEKRIIVQRRNSIREN